MRIPILFSLILCAGALACGDGDPLAGVGGTSSTDTPSDSGTPPGTPATGAQTETPHDTGATSTSGTSGTSGPSLTPTIRSSSAPPDTCGDGVIDADEECDDGDANSDTEPDACRTDCRLPRCGDGVVNTGEVCDEGPANSDLIPDRCRSDCTLPRCGDGVRDSGEQCDLGPGGEPASSDASGESTQEPLGNGDPGAWCDAECRIIQEEACPALDVRDLVEDGDQTDTFFFSWEVDLFPVADGGDELPVPTPCDDLPDATRSAVAFYTVPQSAEYLVRLVDPPAATDVRLWLVRRCGAVAVACEEPDALESDSDAEAGQLRIRSNHIEGEGLFIVAATREAGPERVRIRVSRGALIPDGEESP